MKQIPTQVSESVRSRNPHLYGKPLVLGESEGKIRESDLHEQILQYCKDRCWYVVHSRMDRRSTNAVGTPDFIIATNGGQTFWVEAKSKGKKPTKEQLAAKCWLEKLGHRTHIVWSMGEFIDLVEWIKP